MERWHKVVISEAHQGAGKRRDTTNYVYAKDPVEVLLRCRTMPGVKKGRVNPGIRKGQHTFTPTIQALSNDEAAELEKKIVADNVDLELVKKTCYFGRRL